MHFSLELSKQVESNWKPEWIQSLGTAVWISSPEGTLTYLNEHAETLFGVDTGACVGLPCHQVIAGRDASGRPFCGPQCRYRSLANQSREVKPATFRRGDQWVQVMAITVQAPDGSNPWLVHCAMDSPRSHRLEAYMTKVAGRAHGSKIEPTVLTLREHQILTQLSEDETLYSIAASLHLSYATVRNHVQHILAKLDVHSIEEAVAVKLLSDN